MLNAPVQGSNFQLFPWRPKEVRMSVSLTLGRPGGASVPIFEPYVFQLVGIRMSTGLTNKTISGLNQTSVAR